MKNRIRQILLAIAVVCVWVMIVHALETVDKTYSAVTPYKVANFDC